MPRFPIIAIVLISSIAASKGTAARCNYPVPEGWVCTQKFCWMQNKEEELLQSLKGTIALETIKQYMNLPRYKCADKFVFAENKKC